MIFKFKPKLFIMARRAKKNRKDQRLKLKIVNPDAADIDIFST